MIRFIAVLIAILTASANGAGAADPLPTFADLKSEHRHRVDQFAWSLPSPKPSESSANDKGNFTVWLLSHISIAASEEQALADAMHAKIVKEARSVEVPEAANQILEQLAMHVPESLKPSCGKYRLTVLDTADANAFTVGGGHILITKPLLNELFKDGKRAQAALAFVLGNEIGHGAYRHCRNAYLLMQLEREAKEGVDLGVDLKLLRSILGVTSNPPGSLPPLRFSTHQEFEADLFAFHLSRNAGYESEAVLDFPRWLVARKHPELRKGAEVNGQILEADPLLGSHDASRPPPRERLRRLLAERDGRFDDPDRFGLLRYDPSTDRFSKAKNQSIGKAEQSIVFIHGMHGSEDSFREIIRNVRDTDVLRGTPILIYRYPGNGSLAQAAKGLSQEMTRVCATPAKARFVCHSAGGLVFRGYADKWNGEFDRAIILGTPFRGSAVARLKALLDCKEILKTARFNLPQIDFDPQREGDGPIHHDLEPDSLFLRHLGQSSTSADRCVIVHGRYLGPTKAFAATTVFKHVKGVLRDKVNEHPSKTLRNNALPWLDALTLPEEVTYGDGCVTVKSAALSGAKETIATNLHHLALKTDAETIARVVKFLAR